MLMAAKFKSRAKIIERKNKEEICKFYIPVSQIVKFGLKFLSVDRYPN